MLIQFRRPVSELELYGVFENAKTVVGASVETISTVSRLSCTQCEKAIHEKPYWCCLACSGAFDISCNLLSANASVGTYICISCNCNNEAEKPWLLRNIGDPPPDNPHNVLHTLALAIDPSVPSDSEPTTEQLTTEHRLDRIEKKLEQQAVAFQGLHDRFEHHEKVMQERMEEMFRLLHQVLAHKVQSNSSSG
jgi:hypothetical protein